MLAQVESQASDTRERLLRAAAEAFFARGYHASMDNIAERAEVARQTLYNHFSSKDALFGEVVRIATQSILLSLDGDTSDLRTTLIRFAKAFRAMTLSPEGIALFRTLVSEAQRFPTLARAVYAVGSGQTLRQLSAHIEKAMRNGQLRSDDANFASELLLSMLTGVDRTRYLFGVENPGNVPAAADEVKTARIIDSFLRAYATLPVVPNAPESTAETSDQE